MRQAVPVRDLAGWDVARTEIDTADGTDPASGRRTTCVVCPRRWKRGPVTPDCSCHAIPAYHPVTVHCMSPRKRKRYEPARAGSLTDQPWSETCDLWSLRLAPQGCLRGLMAAADRTAQTPDVKLRHAPSRSVSGVTDHVIGRAVVLSMCGTSHPSRRACQLFRRVVPRMASRHTPALNRHAPRGYGPTGSPGAHRK
jgi:hypothetical protein